MGCDSGRKPLITNKDASIGFIERKLKRKGKSESQITNYIKGWQQLDKRK
jgi:hypothetical protein